MAAVESTDIQQAGSHPSTKQGAGIRVADLGKRYGDRWVVQGVSIEVPEGSLLSIVGPSGCGKSTTLRLLAGLETPDSGEVNIGGQVVSSARAGHSVPVEGRNIGFVFQSYALWPHMSVFEHVAYPLGRLKKAEIAERVSEMLDVVGLSGLQARYPAQLSGGQQQRVALARALVSRPSVLLLDEPLSNLDAQLRTRMGLELKALQRRLGFTAVYVTHDRVEALSLSDRILILDSGHEVEYGTPQEIYERPLTAFGAQFVSTANVFRGRVVGVDGDTVTADCHGVRIVSETAPRSRADISVGDEVAFAVRPEVFHVGAADAGSAAGNPIPGTVVSVTYFGAHSDVVLEALGGSVHTRVPVVEAAELRPGDSVTVVVPPAQVVRLAGETSVKG